MRAVLVLLLHTLLAALFLAAAPVWARGHDHAAASLDAVSAAVHQAGTSAPAHIACDTHRLSAQAMAMAAHGSTPRCKQACLALSAGFAAVLPVQVPALWPADGASPRPDAQPALPPGRVVMPERRPPRAV